MRASTLQGRLLEHLERQPEREILSWFGREGIAPDGWSSYRQLFERVARRAGALRRAGLRPGEACLIVLPSVPASAEILLAVLQLGGLPLLVAEPRFRRLDPLFVDKLSHLVARTEARLAVCPRWMAEAADLPPAAAGVRLLAVDAIDDEPYSDWFTGEPTALGCLQLTSGTTALPRVCAWTQERMLAAVDGMAGAMSLGADDRCCNWTPLYHDMGLVNSFLLSLASGVPLVMLDPMQFVVRPALWLEAISATRSTITWSPNFGYALATERVRDTELVGIRLDSVRSFWSAAERVHAETYERFLARFAPYGVRRQALGTNFGCAENIGGATFSEGGHVVERVDAELVHERGIARVVDDAFEGRVESYVGCGRPLEGLALRILDADGSALGDGRVGELVLDSPSTLVAFMGDTAATDRAMVEGGGVKTGDLAYTRDGELFWVGRTDERLNVRGKKFDPSDFEAVMHGVEGLRPGCFVAFESPQVVEGTQTVVIVSELREEARRPRDEIAAEVRERVTRELGVPVADVLLTPKGTIEKTSSGKRRHLHYKRLYAEHGAAAFEGARV